MRKEYKDCPLPKHTGYEQLAIIEEKNKEYHNKIPSEKIKEYSKRAYENKKLKLLEEKNK